MVSERDRQGRQQQHHQIGDLGRMTGVRPPKNVSRDSQGNENPAEFFASRHSGASTLARQSFGTQPDRRLSQPNRPRYSSPVKGGGRGRERPDMYAQDGERGRKTGVVAPVQERDADGFEDVDAYFGRSSPATAKKSLRKPSAKKQVISPVQYDYDQDDDDQDDDGTREMDLDNNSFSPSDAIRGHQRSNGRSNQSTSSLRKPAATATANSSRPRLSSSSVESASDEDEQVRLAVGARTNGSAAKSRPGPASRKSVGRRAPSEDESESDAPQVVQDDSEEEQAGHGKGKKGRANGAKSRTSTGSAGGAGGSSRKGKERARSPEPEPEHYDEPEDDLGGQQDYGGGDDGYDSDGQDGGVPFNDYDEGEVEPEQVNTEEEEQHEQEEEEEEDEEDEPRASTSKSKAKGKGKGKANGKSKAKADPKPKGKVAKSKAAPSQSTSNGRTRLINKPTLEPIIERKRPHEADDDDDDGVRRSHRTRVEPVEYWRNERVIYKRRASGHGGLAMDAVVKIPKGEVASLTGKKKGAGRGRGESAKPQSRGRSVKPEAYEDEEGVDDLTDPDGIVWSWEGNAETTRRIAFTAKMIDPRPTYNNKFMFQKVFTELDYLASGLLQIPAGAEKPSKAARDNSYTFYCIQGSVSVVVHRSRFSIGPGGTFFVPRGNSYSITATSNRDVKLFFTQARRVFEGPGGETRPDTQEEALARLQAEQEEDEEEEDGEEEEEEED